MIGIFKSIWHNLQLMGFRGARDEFYEQLARSYDRKESLRDFLSEELKIARAPKTSDPSRAYALRLMKARLDSGNDIKYSQIMARVMPGGDKLMLAALDDAPDKPKLLRVIAKTVVNQAKLVSIVRSKVLPPLFIIPGVYAFAYVMATKSIPIIIQVAPPEVWNPFNQSVRSFCEYVAAHGSGTMIAIGAMFAFLFYQLPRWTGKARAMSESVSPTMATMSFFVAPWLLPCVIYRDVQAGLLFNALSVMLQSGRTLPDALKNIRAAGSPWMRWQVSLILAHLDRNPTEYSKAFARGLLSPKLLARLSSQIRTTPSFDQVLVELGSQGSEEIQVEVGSQAGRINGMLMGLAGFTVIFLMVGQIAISNTMSDEMSQSKMMARRMKAEAAARH